MLSEKIPFLVLKNYDICNACLQKSCIIIICFESRAYKICHLPSYWPMSCDRARHVTHRDGTAREGGTSQFARPFISLKKCCGGGGLDLKAEEVSLPSWGLLYYFFTPVGCRHLPMLDNQYVRLYLSIIYRI